MAALGILRAGAAELQTPAARAYDVYVERAQREFMTRVQNGPRPAPGSEGVLAAGPGGEDGIISVPGGLVHHWRARAYVRGANLADVQAVSRDYASYSSIYKSVIRSTLVGRDGDVDRVLFRLKEGSAGITVVLDIQSTVTYVPVNDESFYAVSKATEIREVSEAGTSRERILPVGRDSGYLWRAHTFTHYLQDSGGVFIEMETVGLSRRFPPMLGWLIEPIARRLGRKSVEASLQEFLGEVRRHPHAGTRSSVVQRSVSESWAVHAPNRAGSRTCGWAHPTPGRPRRSGRTRSEQARRTSELLNHWLR